MSFIQTISTLLIGVFASPFLVCQNKITEQSHIKKRKIAFIEEIFSLLLYINYKIQHVCNFVLYHYINQSIKDTFSYDKYTESLNRLNYLKDLNYEK